MSFGLLHRHPLISALFALSFLLFPLHGAAAEESGNRNATFEIPGGLAPITRILEMDSPEPGLLSIERIFQSILDSEPPVGSISGTNSRRINLISYFRQYAKLEQFLQQKAMVPSLTPDQTVRFPLSGEHSELVRTQRLLSFFGIRSRLSVASAGSEVVTTDEWRASSNSVLYDALGLSLRDPALNSIVISLRPEQVPSLLDSKRWETVLRRKSPNGLFIAFVESPDAMRLYIALASCSPEIREALITAAEPGQLMKAADSLSIFGEDLSIKANALVYPGSREAWAGIPASPPLSINALLSQKGAPLLLYSVLRASPSPVQTFVTDSPERLREYFDLIKSYASANFSKSTAAFVSQELLRFFRMSTVTPAGLVLNLKSELAVPLLETLAPGQPLAGEPGPVALTPKLIAGLLPRPGMSPYSAESRASLLEFFLYLQQTHPALLSPESIHLLVQAPAPMRVYVELLGDLEPDAPLFARYLEYCTKIASAGSAGWNVNRTRTSQSIFFLLSALQQQGALSGEAAAKLLSEALDSFEEDDEGLFALKAARFIGASLMPALHAASDSVDPIALGLSGSNGPTPITVQGRQFAADFGKARYERIRGTLATQSHTPIAVLLDLYSTLQGTYDGSNTAPTDTNLRLFSEKLNAIRTAEWTPGDSAKTQKVAQAEIDTIKRSLASGGSWTASAVSPALKAGEIAAQLHTELGITLLSYCYAFGGSPGINVLAYDPNLIRKHRFYDSGQPKKSDWSLSHFVQDEAAGGAMAGSLAGLSLELTRLQASQPDQQTGSSPDEGSATAILYGIRRVPPGLRTDRSQEYVAVATGLGRELLLLADRDHNVEELARRTLSPLISERRLDKILAGRANKGSPEQASASELFFLGNSYFLWSDREQQDCANPAICRAVTALKAIVPNPGSLDYNRFEQEISRYGVLLCSRVGLSKFSFDGIDSYERLERSLRPQSLYDRFCDLKIRLAEINHELGVPAALEEMEGNMAVPVVMALGADPGPADWEDMVRRVNSINGKTVAGWIPELTGQWSSPAEPKLSGTQ